MGNPTASSSKSLQHLFSLLIASLVLLCYFKNGDAAVDRKLMATESHHEFHIIKLTSLLPDSVCDSSSQGHKLPSPSSLKVVHKHGPCHKQHKTKESPSPSPSASELLTSDESRAKSINSRIAFNAAGHTFTSTQSLTLPARRGSALGSGNYIVTVGLGSPKKDLSLVFDTGSGLTWTQCQPCAISCYNQAEPIFNPSQSTANSNVSCSAPQCNQLKYATGRSPGCSSRNRCIYEILYGDQSFSIGYLVKDTLTLSPTDVIPDFYFGCGEDNEGLFGQTAGLIGLGRDQLSIVSQTLKKYGEVFSYCLPSKSSGTGSLTFGKSAVSNTVQYIPFANSQGTTLYFIDILAMYVGSQKLQISSTVFSTAGSIIDSGTVITRLPPAAYTALRNSFRQQMSRYPLGKPVSILDTCYDFSKYTTVTFPTIGIVFGGNKKIDLDASGILYVFSLSQVCLAFAPNSDASDVLIYGNFQQKTMQIVYDVAGGMLGFGAKGCA